MTSSILDPALYAEKLGAALSISEVSATIGDITLSTSGDSDDSWTATCRRCARTCRSFAPGHGLPREEAKVYESQMLQDFVISHQDCTRPPLAPAPTPDSGPESVDEEADESRPPRPAPSAVSGEGPHRVLWVVKQASGGEIRVLAEWHTTYARPEGTELRFYNRAGDDQQRAATVRAGSWHWVCAADALDPKAGES